jgi:hypothetical protein
MASDFQRSKITGVFNAMDADKDGFLDQGDFEALTARWTAVRSWAPGSEGHTRLTAIMMGWWATLLAASDLDRDDKVTLEEVLLVVDQLDAVLDAVTRTAGAMFEAIDEDGNGEISLPSTASSSRPGTVARPTPTRSSRCSTWTGTAASARRSSPNSGRSSGRETTGTRLPAGCSAGSSYRCCPVAESRTSFHSWRPTVPAPRHRICHP